MQVSIVIPIYNAEMHLRNCLLSIKEQNFSDFEVILVDDGSVDGSRLICDEFAKIDERFIVIHKSNGGVSTARNAGIKVAKGEYVGFVDSDDYISPDYLFNISQLLKENPDGVVNSRYIADQQGDKKEYSFPIDKKSKIERNEIIYSLISHDYPSAMWMSFYRRSIVQKHFLDERIHYYEDLDYQISIAADVDSVLVNNIAGYYYRDGSTTHSNITAKTISCFYLIEKLEEKKDELMINNKALYKLERDFIISNVLVGAKDINHDTSLDDVLKSRARKLCKKIGITGFFSKRYYHIYLIAFSPQLFYALYRHKNHIKKENKT